MKLGVKLDIPASAKLITAPIKRVFGSKHYEHIIGIGKDHTASLIIDEDALKELQKKGGRLGTLVMQENLRALEQLTAKQALKIDKLKTQLKIAEDKNKRVMRKITCIGAPLNDNLHHYNKEQLKIFFEIEQILSA